MGSLLLVTRIILAAVFALAGATKLTNLNASRKAVSDFGVANWLAGPIGSVLPFAELGVSALLLPVVSAWWGGLGALVLLVAFIAAITVNLAQGRKPACQCFGQIQSKPIGWPTLVRNGLLALCAVLIVSAGAAQTSIVDVIAHVSGPQALAALVMVAVLAVLAAQAWLIFHLFKQHGRLLLRMDELEKRLAAGAVAPPRPQAPPPQGLPLGAPAPAFALPTLSGELVALDDLHDGGKPAVLIFSDPTCGPCTAMLPEIGRWQRDYRENVRIALISRGTEKANRAKVKESGVRDVLLQKDREVAELYQANGTPAAVLVQADGSIGSRVVGGSEAITGLVAMAAGVPVPTAAASGGNGRGKVLPMPTSYGGLPIGDAAPSVTLPDLSGKTISLSELKGRKTLVLFWNPGCGFCQRMLPDLKAWEESRSKGAPELLVISTGTVEANQQMGLQSPVLLDAEFAVARQFRGGGTPSGVLVDGDGKIASELAVGAPNVLALAGVVQRKPEEQHAHRTDTRAGAAQVH